MIYVKTDCRLDGKIQRRLFVDWNNPIEARSDRNRRSDFKWYALLATVLAKEDKMMHPVMILTTLIVAAVFFFGLYLAKTGKG